jgi:hypothetical protein
MKVALSFSPGHSMGLVLHSEIVVWDQLIRL